MNNPLQNTARFFSHFKLFRTLGFILTSWVFLALFTLLPSTSHAASMIRGLGGTADLGTRAMAPNDDGSTGKIPLGLGFPHGLNFFGTTYSDFYINNNGNITFSGPLYNYTPDPFPVSSQPMIAPFWGDVDTYATVWSDQWKNNVYYKIAGKKIYITWNYVGYFASHSNKLNAFQIVLTDRADVAPGDFDVEFRYEQLQWTTGDASEGSGGLGGIPAQMGFDAGDTVHFYSHPDSQTAQILDLVHSSNVNAPGVWLFEVRSGVVLPGPVAILTDVRIIDTIPAIGIDLDHSSFSRTPASITSVGDTTVIEWYYPSFAADAVADFYFDVILKNPQGGEPRIVNHQLELTYTEANGNPVRTELGPRSVQVLASAFDSSIATDKAAYGPNQNALVTATVKSLSEYTRTVDVAIMVEDAGGTVVSRELYSAVPLAAGNIKDFAATFATGTSYAGDYTVHLFLYENGTDVGEATAPFKITPEIGVTSGISTDKMLYGANEAVTLTSEVRSGSCNYILSDLNVRVTLSDAAGTQLFSEEKPIKTLLPQQTMQLKAYWNTGASLKGRYTVLLQVFDGSGYLNSSSTGFDVAGTASTGSGITGTIAAQPNPVQQGADESIDYSITNTGNEGIIDLTVNILIADAATLDVKRTIPTIRSLPVAAVDSSSITVSTADLAPGQYLALLQIAPLGSQPKTLARATFEVFIDLKPRLEVTKSISGTGNVLVWLNYPWESGNNCPDEALIKRALREAGVLYRVVTEKKDFQTELRNPIYTDFVILGDQQPLEDHFSEELREQINRGKGLIASMFNRTNFDADLFGVNITGYLPGSNYALELVPSDISAGASLITSGQVLRAEVLAAEQNVGWLVEETRTGIARHPGATVRQYGTGKVVFLAFDLGLASSNYEPFALLLADSLHHIHAPVSDLLPGQPVPVEVTLRTLAGNLDLKFDEIFPPQVALFDTKTGLELTNPWTTDLSLMMNEEKTILFNAVLPKERGIYTLTSEISYADGGIWQSSGTYPLDLVVEQNTYDLLDAIIFEVDGLSPSLKDDGITIARAKDILAKIPGYEDENRSDVEIQQIIHELLKAVNALTAVQSVDVAEIRESIDRLLAVYEARWYARQ